MSTIWTDPDAVEIVVTASHTSESGAGLDRGNIAVVLSQNDQHLVVEAADLDGLRQFGDAVQDAITRAEAKAEGVL